MSNQDLTKNNQGSNQGDLISREALKKAFEDTVCIEPMPYAFVKQIIDNAPPVELSIGRMVNGVIIPIKKPQGKRINTQTLDYIGECSECCYISNKYYNFCPNCGADMRGKEE